MSLTLLDLSEAKRAVSTPHSPLPTPVRAVEASHAAIFPVQGIGSDAGYRRISNNGSMYDLFPFVQDQMHRVAYYLFVTNNIAARCVEILRNFLCGEGVGFKAEDPAVQEVLNEFWMDPFNKLDQLIPQMVQDQSVFGELCLQCFTNPISGQTRVAVTDAMRIYAVEYATLEGDPGGASGPPMTVILRAQAGQQQGRRLRVVSPMEDPFSEGYGQLQGDCFYWPLRKARAATRGISDLFRGADLFDAHDQFLWACVEQARHQGAFIWEMIMKGATQEQVNQWLKDHPAGPRSGAVLAHNEQIEWKAVNPSLNAVDKTETGRFIRNTIISGFGFPEHWFAEGGDVNRATALEMGDPALKMLTERQRFWKFQIEDLLRYVISAKIAAGVLPESVNQEFEVQMPELSVKDQGKIAAAFQSTVSTVSLARADGLMDEETAANLIALQTQQLGVEVDAAEMLQKARAEKDARRLEDYRNPLPDPGRDREGAANDDKQVPRRDAPRDDNGEGAYA